MNELIDKELAIQTILGEYPDAHYPEWYADIISKLPSVTTNDLWTPCSVTLPLKEGVYIVTGRNGTVSRFLFSDTDASKEYWHRVVLAWMPMPKAYIGENNE